MSRTFKIAIAALIASVAFAPAALAQVGVEQVSVHVAYGDLDMSTVAGGKTLLKRIEGAARRVCGDASPRSPLKPRSVPVCRRESVANAVRGLNIATLTLAWNGSEPGQTQLSAR